MKTGRIFWGTFFVTVGVLFFLENIDLLTVDWGCAWRWWPILLVLAGGAMLFRSVYVKVIAAVVAAIALGLLVVSVLNFSWVRGIGYGGPVAAEDTLTVPYHASVKHAHFTLESGAGVFTVADTTSALATAMTRSSLGSYTLSHDSLEDAEHVTLSLAGRHGPSFLRKIQNRAGVMLNASPVWDLVFNVGASKVNLDLTPFNVKNVDVDCGAASITVTLGDRAPETHVSIDAGASTIKLRIPESVGCEVRLDAALSSKRLSGFERKAKDLYCTENVESAAKKVYVDITAGVSSIRVERY